MEPVLYLLSGLFIGGLIGYYFFKSAILKNYIAKTDFENLRQQFTELQIDQAKRISKEEYLNEKLTLFKTEIESLHNLSKEQFKNLATDIMKEKKAEFVLENKKELSFVIDPFKNDLKAFKEKVEATRKEDIHDLTSLKKELELLQQLNTQLSDDAKNLTSALKSEVKMQGNWGEDRLNMILEAEGLQKYVDYSREEMYRDTDAEINRRPDFILHLPNGKHLIIDSKVSLTAYVNYFNASDPEEKKTYLKQHLRW